MTRRKRMLLWSGLLVMLAGTGLVGVRLWTARGSYPSRAGFDEIRNGMTKTGVEALLGLPGHYSTRPLWITLNESPEGALLEEGPVTEPSPEVWTWDWGVIQVFFDADERVTQKSFQ